MVEIVNPLVADMLRSGEALDLDLGCGDRKAPGMFGVDARRTPAADIVADLEQPLDGLPSGSARRIRASHVLEHIHALDQLLDEVHRLLRPDGTFEVIVPHAANPLGWSDPTHCRLFGLYSLCYLSPIERQPLRRKVPCYRTDHLFEVERPRLAFSGRSAVVLDRVVNARASWVELFERRGAGLVWPSEIRAVLRPIA